MFIVNKFNWSFECFSLIWQKAQVQRYAKKCHFYRIDINQWLLPSERAFFSWRASVNFIISSPQKCETGWKWKRRSLEIIYGVEKEIVIILCGIFCLKEKKWREIYELQSFFIQSHTHTPAPTHRKNELFTAFLRTLKPPVHLTASNDFRGDHLSFFCLVCSLRPFCW